MYRDNLFRELIIDNFAGGGGASVGIELALGAPVATALIRANCADMAVCKRPIKTMAQLNKIFSAA